VYAHLNISTTPVAERLRAYPALPERAGVGSVPANSDSQNVPTFRRWRFDMKLSHFYNLIYNAVLVPDCIGYSKSTVTDNYVR
jgi:hypothetical protein